MDARKLRCRFILFLLILSLRASDLASAEESCASAPCHASLLKAANVHPPTETCDICHESMATPHPQEGKKTFKLTQDQPALCESCHETVIAKTMTTLHGPIAEGRCTACHDAHGGPFPKLLAKEFPPDSYASYTDTEFALCFDCHKRDAFQNPRTSSATNFRDGERNLHYLHVNKKKGRSCLLCHNVHGASNTALIANSVSFGKWKLPLKFVMSETGGSCSPGCHKPQRYDRKAPASKPLPSAARRSAPAGK